MKFRKAIVSILIITMLMGLVTAGLMSYVNKLQTNIKTEQSVMLDNSTYDMVIMENITGIGGNTIRTNHTLNVRCECPVNLTIKAKSVPGILVYYEYYEGVICHSLTNPHLFKTGLYTIVCCYELDINLKPSSYQIINTFSVTE